MDYTTNLNLKKPNGEVDGDFVIVEDLNSNFDSIDTAIGGHIANTNIHVTAEKQAEWDQNTTNIAALKSTKTATLTTTWTGTAAPYTQTITVTGITANDEPRIYTIYDSVLATALLQKEAVAMVTYWDTGTDIITFTCLEDKPTVAIPIRIKGV